MHSRGSESTPHQPLNMRIKMYPPLIHHGESRRKPLLNEWICELGRILQTCCVCVWVCVCVRERERESRRESESVTQINTVMSRLLKRVDVESEWKEERSCGVCVSV